MNKTASQAAANAMLALAFADMFTGLPPMVTSIKNSEPSECKHVLAQTLAQPP
jgi:hypothetical protein